MTATLCPLHGDIAPNARMNPLPQCPMALCSRAYHNFAPGSTQAPPTPLRRCFAVLFCRSWLAQQGIDFRPPGLPRKCSPAPGAIPLIGEPPLSLEETAQIGCL